MPEGWHLTPGLGKVIILREEPEKRSGSIIIPDTAQERPLEGIVVAVSPHDTIPTVEPGDRVYFGQYAGTNITIEDREYLIVVEKDIHCIIREEHA